MTGEMFNLLREHSILADLLSGPAEPDEAFAAGVRRGLSGDCLAAELFSVRAACCSARREREGCARPTPAAC